MLKPIAVWNPEKEIWEKENPLSSKQWVLFSATFPTSGMMRGGKLFPLPQSVPPTAETESSSTPIPEECFHTPDTAPDAPNKGSNTRSKPAGLGNQVKELGESLVLVLPTPRVSDSKGVDNETEWARHSPGLAAMSFHLRSDDDQAGRDDEKLFSTPQARDWKGVPGDTYNLHNLARDISRLVAEEPDVLLLPTPQAFDSSNHVRSQEQIDDMRFGLNGRTQGGGRNLREVVVNEVQGATAEQGGDDPLLPTPMAKEIGQAQGQGLQRQRSG